MQQAEEMRDQLSREGEVIDREGSLAGKKVLLVVLAVLVLGFIAYSVSHLNMHNIETLNYPTSSYNKTCNLAYPQSFPYLYIDLTASQPVYRCVSQCPSGWNQFTVEDSEGQQINSYSEEEVNSDLGGICWSQGKKKAMQARYSFREFSAKINLLQLFIKVLIIMAACFVYSLSVTIMEPILHDTGITIMLAYFNLAIFIFQVVEGSEKYRAAYLIFGCGLALVLLIGIFCNWGKTLLARSYMQEMSSYIQNTSCSVGMLFLATLVYNIINFGFMVFVVFQYICLASSEVLVKQQERIFYGTELTWWKYCLLLLEWMLVSNIIRELYTFAVVKMGYQMYHLQTPSLECFTFENVVNVVAFSFIQVLLWLPLKIISLCKPSGAVIRQRDDESFSGNLSRASYCCCGLLINKLHRYTFNPYLVLALDQGFHNLDHSLKVIQTNYHEYDVQYDKSSLWVHNFSGQVLIIIFTLIFLAAWINQDHETFLKVFITDTIILALSIEVSRLNLALWSTLVEVTEFITINQL